MTAAIPVLLLAGGLLLVPAPSAVPRVAALSGHPGRRRDRLRALLSQRTGKRPLVLSLAVAVSVAGLLAGIVGWLVAVVLAVVAGGLCHRLLRPREHGSTDPLNLASGWDLLAAALRAGLPVPVTVRTVAAEFTGTAEAALLEVADSLALGADPVSAWERAMRDPDTAELARSARRVARTGSGLAGVAEGIAAQARESLAEQAHARAQRATVWVSAPLGLCFLPAFLCLGVAPVVVGMLDRLM
ncbi:type II secretion system (T2SS) protein F [Halopolyspora algeriensis]|uniref:Type II secretion system (T2SS) protein F n=1 Tax=Halopolyspora algeriensis TaxID=1500506 RepID=A0A368VIK6_9ACTN|nr:type II secretion system F family protein [Halopolyspora algeriensis]RCW40199.1 type II secretion system (T2SS) protein F [Halopolyspora algeriensis]TQM46319.1 type II secretion system (T2SS) protein F [Halopolyspora algeriensis]